MPHSTKTKPFAYSDEKLSEYAENTHSRHFKFQKLAGPLFPEAGKRKEDVAQHSLGECFFDAAIISIIDTHPELLDDILTMTDDGKVVGKIYIEKNGLYEAEYFELDYTDFLPKHRGIRKILNKGDIFHEHANYVVMLEKLYAVSKLHQEITKKNANLSEIKDSINFVNFLDGGLPDDVYNRLTGKKAEFVHVEVEGRKQALISRQHEKTIHVMIGYVMILHELLKETGDLNQKFDDIVENLTARNEVKKNPRTPEIKKQMISFLLKNENENRTEIENELGKLLESLATYRHNQHVPKKEFTGVALPEYFDLLRSNIDHIENESNHLREKNNDKIEIGYTYSSIENAIFEKIKTALKNGKAVSIGSKEIQSDEGAAGHKESIKNGIAGSHAYAVHDIVEYGDKKYIVITNPWQSSYKRKYIQNENNEIVGVEDWSNDSPSLVDAFGSEIKKTFNDSEQRANSFFVELSDFYRHTNHIYISATHPSGKLLFIKNLENLLQWYAPVLPDEDDYKVTIESVLIKIKEIRSGKNEDEQFLSIFYTMTCLEAQSSTPEKRILTEAIKDLRKEFSLYDASKINIPDDEKFISAANIIQCYLNTAKIIKNKSAEVLVSEIESKAIENGFAFDFSNLNTSDSHAKLAVISAAIALGDEKMGVLRSFLPEIQSCWQYEKLQASISKNTELLNKISTLESMVDNRKTQPELHGERKLSQPEKDNRLARIIEKISTFFRAIKYHVSFWKESEKHAQDNDAIPRVGASAAAA